MAPRSRRRQRCVQWVSSPPKWRGFEEYCCRPSRWVTGFSVRERIEVQRRRERRPIFLSSRPTNCLAGRKRSPSRPLVSDRHDPPESRGMRGQRSATRGVIPTSALFLLKTSKFNKLQECQGTTFHPSDKLSRSHRQGSCQSRGSQGTFQIESPINVTSKL